MRLVLQKTRFGAAVAIIAVSLGSLHGQSGSSSAGSSGTSSTAPPSTGSTSAPATAPSTARWSADPVPSPDQAPGSPDNSSSGSYRAGAGGLRGSDYLAPLSKMRWGAFSVAGWDAFASWSNQPLGYNGQINDVSQNSGIPNLGASLAVHASTTMSANWRWGKGFVGIQYAPSLDYQTATNFRQINHNISLFLDHPFRFGKWRLTLGVHSGTVSQLSTVYQPPSLSPLLSLDAPITNQDVLVLLNEPLPLQPPSPNLLLLNRRFFTGLASASLERQLNGRDTLSINASAMLNRTLNFGNQTGSLFNYPQSSGGSLTINYMHSFSRRQQVTFSLMETQAFGGGLLGSYGSQQSGQLIYTWLPSRRWSFTVGAGPARVQSAASTSIRYVSTVRSTYTVPYGAIIDVSYMRGFDLQGFAGGQDTKIINVNWGAPFLNRGHRWHYNITTGIQLASAVNARNQTGSTNGYSSGTGFVASAQLVYPLSRAMALSFNYGYFYQQILQNQSSAELAFFHRNVVSAGLHYTFGGLAPGQHF